MSGFGHAAAERSAGIGDDRNVVGTINRDRYGLVNIGTNVIGDAGGVGLGYRFVFF